MTAWTQVPWLAADTESTGVDPLNARTVQVATALVLPGSSDVDRHVHLLNPGVPIPAAATAVHGITDDQVADLPDPTSTLAEVADRIVNHLSLGYPLLAFNAAYDCTLLEAELERHDLPTITSRLGAFAPVIDPLVLHTRTSRIVSRKLGHLCDVYGLRHDGQHDAGHDALAAARVAWRISQVNPGLAGFTAQQLHDLQATWRREQCDTKRAEYDGLGWKHDGWDPSWPVRRTPEGVHA